MEVDAAISELAARALNHCELAGAKYADVRIIQTDKEVYAASKGRLESSIEQTSLGCGVRVLVNGAWGFASSHGLGRVEIDSACQNALEFGRMSAASSRKTVDIGDPVVSRDFYHTPVKTDPFSVSLSTKVNDLVEAVKAMQTVEGVVVASGTMEFVRREKHFFSSEGSQLKQIIIESGAGLMAGAVGDDGLQVRNFPTNLVRQQGTGGYELIENLNLIDNAIKTAEEAVQLTQAAPCPSGTFDVIFDPSLLAHILHEIVGHNTELDRILWDEIGYAGTSFVSKDLGQRFQYASPLVNIYLDSTFPEGLGTFGYDDEGVPAQRSDLIRDGVLVGFHTSRETASQIGQKSNGCMRADGHNRMPIIRMTNILLEPGDWELPDLMADTKKGFLLAVNRSWSIDHRRENFDYTAQYGYEIHNGKLGRMVKAPAFMGKTVNFWKTCDAICNEKYFKLYGLPICGKGEPWQGGPISHGCSPARFRNVHIGQS